MSRKPFLKLGAAMVLCTALAVPGATELVAQESGTINTRPTEVYEIDGFAWLASNNQSKLSFLLGVENAIAMEYAMSYATAERTGNDPIVSSFQRGWTMAFHDTSRQQIIDRINSFYQMNPTARNRHVFDVIWTEMVLPVIPRR